MSGISDIKKEFKQLAPADIKLVAVRMNYDNDNGEQVFEFDITDELGPRTLWQRASATATVEEIVAAAVQSALTPVDGPPLGLVSDYSLDPQANAGGPYFYERPEVPVSTPFSSQASATPTEQVT